MVKSQEHNNRSQGQRLRRAKENASLLVETQELHGQVLAQHGRDIKVLQSNDRSIEERLAALERQQARNA